ncbi:hypothetical protein EJ02DRAFT_468459, partial [Clathrospora elynae]
MPRRSSALASTSTSASASPAASHKSHASWQSAELNADNILSGERKRKGSRKKVESDASEAEDDVQDSRRKRGSRTEILRDEATAKKASTKQKPMPKPAMPKSKVQPKPKPKLQPKLKKPESPPQQPFPPMTSVKYAHTTQSQTHSARYSGGGGPEYYSDEEAHQKAQPSSRVPEAPKPTTAIFEGDSDVETNNNLQPPQRSEIDLTNVADSSSSNSSKDEDEDNAVTGLEAEPIGKLIDRAVKKKKKKMESQEDEAEMQRFRLQPEKGRFIGFSLDELEAGLPASTPGTKKKRQYKKKTNAEQAESLSPRMKRLEDLSRLTMLITFDPD